MNPSIGRPELPLPFHPNRVLAQAIKTGLSTTVFIQGTIKNKFTKHLFETSRVKWKEATQKYYQSRRDWPPDFSHFTSTENNIRKNLLQMLFENAATYGNTESARVKISADNVGPMNQRLNIGGAALREFAMIRYPFPKLEVLNPFAEDENPKFGYFDSTYGPLIEPIHITLPELDFIDSCRTQIQILCTHCYIHDVPIDVCWT